MSEQMKDLEVIDAVEFDVEDLANPRSVINLLSESHTFTDAFKRLLQRSPDYLEKELPELQHIVKPTFTLSRLRLSFWNEYENAIQHNRKMRINKITAGVCTEKIFRRAIDDDAKLAYILCPPKDYMITVKEALDAGLDNLRAIVSANVIDSKGNLNAKAADVVLKAIALLDMRVKGAVIQRIDQRNVNLNLNKDVTPKGGALTVEELDRQIEAAKQKLIRDVTSARLPEAPLDITKTMKELNVEVVQVGGANRVDVE